MSKNFNKPLSLFIIQPLQQSQTNSSNIPTHKPSNNFQQQTLPRYNPPPNPQHISNNIPARRIQRGRYSTGTTSLIQPPGSFLSHQTPLASPALSTTSTAISAQDNQQQKSHIPFQSRLPTQQDMLKFQVRKSEASEVSNTNSTVTANPTNAQIQVSY